MSCITTIKYFDCIDEDIQEFIKRHTAAFTYVIDNEPGKPISIWVISDLDTKKFFADQEEFRKYYGIKDK